MSNMGNCFIKSKCGLHSGQGVSSLANPFGVGSSDPPQPLGPRLLPNPQGRPTKPLGHHPRSGLQMDPHPLSLLAGAHPLRRTTLPQITSKTGSPLLPYLTQPTTQAA